MPGDIWETARGQSGFQACRISQMREGDLEGGVVIWGQCTQGSEHQAKGLRVHSPGHGELGEVWIRGEDDEHWAYERLIVDCLGACIWERH